MAKKKKPSAPRSKKTGKFVSQSYAKRYPHLVEGAKRRGKLPAVKTRVRPKVRPAAPTVAQEPRMAVGAELEITATTRGGTPRRDKRGGRRMDPNVLALKVYVTMLRPMTFPEAARLAQRALMAASWNPYEISIEVIDWMKGRRVGRYRTDDEISDALVSFRDALKASSVRVALVDH